MSHELDLCSLIEDFGSEDKCRAYIEKLRWPKGITCPSCKSDKISRIIKRNQFDCDACRYQFSATAGTIFHDTHLPLWKWFLATYLLCESRKGMSANQMKRQLAISYKTAWYLCHRIRKAMLETDQAKLGGTVEMDETYIGGYKRGGRGPHASEKEIVVGIRKRNGDLRLFHVRDTKSATLAKYIRENVREDVDVIITDDWVGYPRAMMKAGLHGDQHKTINHSGHVYVMGNIHTNTVESAFSLLKRGIVGTWHKVSAKHLPAYLDEMCFRFNNRKNEFLFRDTMLKLIGSPNLEYKHLTAKVEDAA
jgi:transposase-like protein